jgi:N-acetylglucosaminyldiphosphoundecaprenol N-acetyl-beta-D-mannosaminyltransferase
MVMEGHDLPAYQQVVNGADLVTPDGMPLVWALRRLGVPAQQRVYGPDLALAVAAAAADAGIPIGLYGGREDVLADLQASYRQRFPALRVVYAHSPPFRELSAAEDAAVVQEIRDSGARILFVGLGCPKQECWMAKHRGRVPAVMLGVGAAFDFHAGRVRQAPGWLQRAGLEWLFRLFMEPRRLWYRYLKHNPRFLWLLARQLRQEGSHGRAAVL